MSECTCMTCAYMCVHLHVFSFVSGTLFCNYFSVFCVRFEDIPYCHLPCTVAVKGELMKQPSCWSGQ